MDACDFGELGRMMNFGLIPVHDVHVQFVQLPVQHANQPEPPRHDALLLQLIGIGHIRTGKLECEAFQALGYRLEPRVICINEYSLATTEEPVTFVIQLHATIVVALTINGA